MTSSSNVAAQEEKEVSTDELVQAAEELVQRAKSGTFQAVMIHARLHALMAGSKSRLRTAIESKLPSGLVTHNNPGVPLPVPTTKDLVAAGYASFDSLIKGDAELTPATLIRAGVVQKLLDVQTLGIKNIEQLVQTVGPPHRIRQWHRQSLEDKHPLETVNTMWQRDFSVPLWLNYESWEKNAQWLVPKDLRALQFSLGAQLDADSRRLQSILKTNIPSWLGKASKESWIKLGQLTLEQYERLALATMVPSASTTQQPPEKPVTMTPVKRKDNFSKMIEENTRKYGGPPVLTTRPGQLVWPGEASMGGPQPVTLATQPRGSQPLWTELPPLTETGRIRIPLMDDVLPQADNVPKR